MAGLKRCCYVLPIYEGHHGIQLKVDGQLASLRSRFKTSLIRIFCLDSRPFFWRFLAYLVFEYQAFMSMCFASVIYVRYNPKAVFLNLLLPFFAVFKSVYVEHNTIMATELAFLGRHGENRWHHFFLRYLKGHRITHVAVNDELKLHLLQKGLSCVVYAQNGYLAPALDHVDNAVLSDFMAFKSSFKQVAVFTGNGHAWHGLDEIVSLMDLFPEIGLVVIGPYALDNRDCIHAISSCHSDTVCAVINNCDFAISTFRWDMLSIFEGSPLKSRQFLCHGCPVLVNYYDCAADFDALRPYIVDFRHENEAGIKRLSRMAVDREALQALARECLSWDVYFDRVFSEFVSG